MVRSRYGAPQEGAEDEKPVRKPSSLERLYGRGAVERLRTQQEFQDAYGIKE